MTTDERLDRLTDRTDALAQTVGLLHASTGHLRASIEAHDRYFVTLMKATQQLLGVATNHERHLNRLESH